MVSGMWLHPKTIFIITQAQTTEDMMLQHAIEISATSSRYVVKHST